MQSDAFMPRMIVRGGVEPGVRGLKPGAPYNVRMAASETVEAEGHLIDSGMLSGIMDKIIEVRGSYEILNFDIGRTNDDPSRIKIRVTAPDVAALADLLQQLTFFGCHAAKEKDAVLKPAEMDRCVPDDFYSTTNHRTHVRVGGAWVEVERQRMDAVIVVANVRGERRKLLDARRAGTVVSGRRGVCAAAEPDEGGGSMFAVTGGGVPPDRPVEGRVAHIADMRRVVEYSGGRNAVVAGPVVVHTGG